MSNIEDCIKIKNTPIISILDNKEYEYKLKHHVKNFFNIFVGTTIDKESLILAFNGIKHLLEKYPQKVIDDFIASISFICITKRNTDINFYGKIPSAFQIIEIVNNKISNLIEYDIKILEFMDRQYCQNGKYDKYINKLNNDKEAALKYYKYY